VLAAAVAGVALAAGAAIALADPSLPSPASSGSSPPTSVSAQCNSTTSGACDTELTPVAKDGCQAGFSQVAGAVFPGAAACPGYDPSQSPTDPTIDFFAVRFWDAHTGYAGGAACQAQPPPGTTGAALDSYLTSCPRVPVIWRYSEPPGQAPLWREVYRGTTPGFVGAIAFISRDGVLAVGGDGCYPRREQPCAPGTGPVAGDPAGNARVWEYDGSDWSEPFAAHLPAEADGAPMRGLTALDCTPRPHIDGQFCVAGGYQQLWMWHDGRFTKGYDTASPTSDLDSPGGLRYRVRSVRFVPGAVTPITVFNTAGPQVWAVTDGCCDTNVSIDHPRLLEYDGSAWHAQIWGFPGEGSVDLGKAAAGNASGASADQLTDLSPTGAIPDSFYSVDPFPDGQLSVIATPGGPAAQPEAPSQILTTEGSSSNGADAYLSALPLRLDDLRLVAGDGDLQRSACPVANVGSAVAFECVGGGGDGHGGPDDVIDWAVGQLTSSGEAAALTTTRSGVLAPDPLSCPANDPTQSPTSCRPSIALAEQLKSESLLVLPGYSLNGFTTVGQAGISWAVGDRGAIFRLGGIAGPSAEPNAPALGARTVAAAPSPPAYQPYRLSTVAGEPGVVPPLASQPLEQVPTPEWVPAGTPNPAHFGHEEVAAMAMSRTGDEGWAIGAPTTSSSAPATLYHYDGATWTRCEVDGIGVLVPPDPACAGVADLIDGGVAHNSPVHLTALARVPWENGGDPSRANTFELVAAGWYDGGEKIAILDYRNGRWAPDTNAMSELPGMTHPVSIAFAAPDDGWMTLESFSNAGRFYGLYHYDGRRWFQCTSGTALACDDPHGRLPISASPDTSFPGQLRLTSAGDRVYLFGGRSPGCAQSSTLTPCTVYPVILYDELHGGGWTAGDGGLDPLGESADAGADEQGCVDALSMSTIRAAITAGQSAASDPSSNVGARRSTRLPIRQRRS
jgi:hypothetical protein